MSQIDRSLAEAARAWPFEEARKLVTRTGGKVPAKGYVLFETGYGPSGLPHLGTFQEVARTLMVRHALSEMVDWPSRLIAFSDDMDGMRKVPPGVPHQDMMHAHLDQPLSRVPDPYGCGHDSYAAHNNNLLRQFLDRRTVRKTRAIGMLQDIRQTPVIGDVKDLMQPRPAKVSVDQQNAQFPLRCRDP